MTVIFSDSFTAAVDTPLTSHTPDIGTSWVEVYNTTGQSGLGAFIVAAATGWMHFASDINSAGIGVRSTPDPASAEYDVIATLVAGEGDPETGTKPTGFFARRIDANTQYVFRHLPNAHADNSDAIFKVVGGVSTLLASVDSYEGIPETYKFEVRDAAKKLYKDDVELVSTADNAITGAGACGLFNGAIADLGGHCRSPYAWDTYRVDVVAAGPSPVTVPLDALTLATAAAAATVQSDVVVALATIDLVARAQLLTALLAGGNVTVPLDALMLGGAALDLAPQVAIDQVVALDALWLSMVPLTLPTPSPTPTFRVYVDWDEDGFGAGDEITEFVASASVSIGLSGAEANIAAVGQASLQLDNAARQFTPGNTTGPYYGKIRPHLPVIIEADRPDWPTPVRLFTGRLRSLAPDSQRYGARYVSVVCEDAMAVFQTNNDVAIPVQIDQTPDTLLRLIAAAAFRKAAARAALEVAARPVDGADGLIFSDRTYAFVTTPGAAHQVAIGTTVMDALDNLAAAINGAAGIGTTYGSGTLRHPDVWMDAGERETLVIPPTLLNAYNQPEVGNGGGYMQAQKIVMPFEGQIGRIRVWLNRITGTAASYPLTVRVHKDDGSGAPDMASFASDPVSLTGLSAEAYVDFNLVSERLPEGTPLYIVLSSPAPVGASYWFYAPNDGFYSAGYWLASDNSGAAWTHFTDKDVRLDVAFFGVPYLEAQAPGAWANSIAVSGVSARLQPATATLTGGSDVTADFDADAHRLNIVGGEWRAGETNAMSAVEEVINSVGGFFWIARDGTPTYRPLDWFLRLPATPPAMTVDNAQSELLSEMSVEALVNAVTATTMERMAIVDGVVAEAPEQIAVPGRWGQEPIERWTANAPTEPGTVTVKLPFVNPETGNYVAALGLVPLEAGLDFTINDDPEGEGFDYTTHGLVTISIAPLGGELELTLSNAALGTLYVTHLRVRGRRFTDTREVKITRQDDASISLYGRREAEIDAPFAVSVGYLENLVFYFLQRFVPTQVRARALAVDNPIDIDGVSPYRLGIGDVIEVSEAQTGIAARHLIQGIHYAIEAAGDDRVQFNLRKLDDNSYWILGDPVYGVLGTTTRLGV